MSARQTVIGRKDLMSERFMKTVDVIIPTYKPDRKLFQLLDQLAIQTRKPQKIFLINTEEKFFNRLVYGTSFNKKYRNVVVYHHSKREFDHGNTRNRGIKHSEADIVVMMTQDAVPEDEYLIESLIAPLEAYEDVAISYARQLPDETSNEIERFTRQFNYPPQSRIKSIKDLNELGIKTFFCSNVCAAYKRKEFWELGGFCKHTIFNEDMIFASGAMKAGKKVSYTAEAKVYHTHNYTARKQLHRNFDLGVSQADHPEVFEGIPSESEGIKLVKMTADYLWQKRKAGLIFVLVVQSAFKLLGYQLGKRYKKLPKALIRRLTMDQDYWRRFQMKKEVAGIDATKGYGKNNEKEI